MGALWLANAIRTEASLAFIGLGLKPPTPTWGGMIREGFDNILDSRLARDRARASPILIVVFALNLLGDGLRDAIDPQSQGRNMTTASGPVCALSDLTRQLPQRRASGVPLSRNFPLTSARAKRWRWSASPAPARASPRSRSCACCRLPTVAIEGEIRLGGRDSLLSLSEERMRGMRGDVRVDDLSGADDEPQPGADDRPPDRRGADLSPRARPHGRRGGERCACSSACRCRRRASASIEYPHRFLRRHAPARDDRDGARLQAEAADRRRADDGARRDRAGADPRTHQAICRTRRACR